MGKGTPSDRELGMHRAISRRDFLYGAAGSALAAGALGAGCAPSPPPAPGPIGAAGTPPGPDAYPPARLGLRGSHPGAFETAHELAFEGRRDWGAVVEPDAEYDWVIVGAGISGLAAAWFVREHDPSARVLLLENHDDFGGHARRNEFAFEGRTILGYGGGQSLEAPGEYSEVARTLLARLGVEPDRLSDAYDHEFFRRHGLAPALFFDRASYGVDRLVRTDLFDPSLFLPTARAEVPIEQAVAAMPLEDTARSELLKLVRMDQDRLPDHGLLDEPDYLETISYRDLLTRHLGVQHPQVLGLLQDLPSGYFGHGIDAIPALYALGFGLPGLDATSLGTFSGLIRKAIAWSSEPYTYHFPDGNASVARLLVRDLIPAVHDAATAEDLVTASLDYGALDRPEADVRLRLDSTVVRVEHEGAAGRAKRVQLTYVRAGRAERVRARRAVLACYNRIVPHLCPELPDEQKQALAWSVKIPLVYSNVLLRNWRAFAQLGVALAHCPGSWHRLAMLDFPVDYGAYRFAREPDDPIVVHLSRSVVRPGPTPVEQSRAGRHELLGTSFETLERAIRTQLAGMLGGADFDPARDIAGIVVNRWPHGYARDHNPLFDPEHAPGEAPHERGRRRFGRIAIANSDAGARAYLDEAIDQAWRAVGELAD